MARRSLAGHYPISELWPWATMAGSSLHCVRCGVRGEAPLPGAEGYGEAVEGFLRAHKRCADGNAKAR